MRAVVLIKYCLLFLSLSMIPWTEVAAQDARSIIDRYIQVLGGRQKLQSLNRIESYYSGYYGVTPLELQIISEYPNRSFAKITSNGVVISELGFDGVTGYAIESGVRREMFGSELEDQKYSSLFLWFLNYEANGIRLRYTETITVEFINFDIVERTMPNGTINYLYFNSDSGLLAQEMASDGSYEVYSNYQYYEGITIPLNITYADMNGQLSATLTNINFGYRNQQPTQNPSVPPTYQTSRNESSTNQGQNPANQNSNVSTPSNTPSSNSYGSRVGTGKKLALVIGNSNYQNAGVLKNPINDARSMAQILGNLGFEVIIKENASLVEMKKAVDDFGAKLERYEVGLFYYAGHGIQTKGKNYLIPVEAQIQNEQQVEYNCIAADRVLAFMDYAKSKVNIIILDACRNNPFERSWSRSSGGSGLAFMNAPTGSIIAYATSPGNTASDGDGRNGLYTEALLSHMNTPNITIEQMFKRVRTDVEKKSGNKQTPWESTSLKGEFYFTTK